MLHNTGTSSGAVDTAPEALSIAGPQPVWMTLDEARERSFTGEVVFELDPEVVAYFDAGIAYYAERAGDTSLGGRLFEAGVIDMAQLERGTVRVGDVQHLGRLFDRDPSVDRDAVLVVTEMLTSDLIAEIANREVASVRTTAYRHHPSGLHRWFVAPRDIDAVHPLLEQPQRLAVAAKPPREPLFGLAAEELQIEWDEPFDAVDESGAPVLFDEFVMELSAMYDGSIVDEPVVDDVDAIELSIAMAEFVDVVDADGVMPEGTGAPSFLSVPSVDGAGDDATEDSGDSGWDVPVGPPTMVDGDGDEVHLGFAMRWPNGTEQAARVGSSSQGVVELEMPPLLLGDAEISDDGDVSDDVAAAVRRAIAAIESATLENPVIPGPLTPVAPPAPAFAGFAPPTMDMRAEVLYGQIDAEASTEVAATHPPASEPSTSWAGLGAAMPTMAFADDAPSSAGSGDGDRSSALRRLIGSLRRK